MTKRHGVFAIQRRGSAALDRNGKRQLRMIRQTLETPEGVQEALRQRAALGLVMLSALEAYIASEVQAGRKLGDLPAARLWPAMQNSTVRMLAALARATPGGGDEHAAELERIRAAVGVRAATAGPKDGDGE